MGGKKPQATRSDEKNTAIFRKAGHAIVDQLTLSRAGLRSVFSHYGPNALAVFVDDSGDINLNEHHPYFSVAGPAFPVLAYDDMVANWLRMKQDLMNLSPGDDFHASEVMPKMSHKAVLELGHRLRLLPSHGVGGLTHLIDGNLGKNASATNVAAATGAMQSVLSQIYPTSVLKQVWIMETSGKSDRLLMVSQILECQRSAQIPEPEGQIFFMKKSKGSAEPCLEIADLYAWLFGRVYIRPFFSPSVRDRRFDALCDCAFQRMELSFKA